jgi:hypothetical protein
MELNQKMSQLPILRGIETSPIGKQLNSFRKGEKGLYDFLKLGLIAVAGYFSWVYVLPQLFMAIGQAFAIAATVTIVVFSIFAAPVIFKGIRVLTRFLHKSVIRHDPFMELESQRGKMEENKVRFQKAKGKIISLKSEMEISADESEKKAKSLESKILSLQGKSVKLKALIDDMIKTNGVSIKSSDEYVNAITEFNSIVSEASRRGYELNQEKDFVMKYGSRAAIMKKFGQKLKMVENAMDIKILDFDATITILKKDYEFAAKSREATETAKSAMLFTSGWELEYAMDVVTSTIAEDIAITSGNINDIDSLTSTYNFDSDELYNNLNLLADKINTGGEKIPSAKSYSGEDYKLTSKDKLKTGGFEAINENMF